MLKKLNNRIKLKNILNFFYVTLDKKKCVLLVVLILNLIATFISVFIPLLNAQIINYVVYINERKINENSLIYLLVLFASLNIFSIIVIKVNEFLSLKLISISSFVGKNIIISHLFNVDYSLLSSWDKAALNQRINNETDQVVIFSLNICKFFITASVNLFCSIVILLRYGTFVLFVIISTIIMQIFLFIILNDKIVKVNYKLNKEYSGMYSKFFVLINNLKSIRMNGKYYWCSNKLEDKYNKFWKLSKKNFLLNSFNEVMSILINLVAQFVVFLDCGIKVINNTLTVGLFTVFMSYFNLLIQLLTSSFQVLKEYRKTIASFSWIKEVLDIEIDKDGVKKIEDNIKTIEFREISYSYDGTKKLYNGLSLTMNRGNIYWLKGSNGFGKSTLFMLLVGIISLQAGEILINEINITELDKKDFIKDKIGNVDQKPIIFGDSIEECFTNYDELKEEINEYMQEFKLFNKNDREDKISEGTLSGGELQKIQLIESFLYTKDILLYDEPLASLDSESKIKFLNKLSILKNNAIVLIISHEDINIADYQINLTNNQEVLYENL